MTADSAPAPCWIAPDAVSELMEYRLEGSSPGLRYHRPARAVLRGPASIRSHESYRLFAPSSYGVGLVVVGVVDGVVDGDGDGDGDGFLDLVGVMVGMGDGFFDAVGVGDGFLDAVGVGDGFLDAVGDALAGPVMPAAEGAIT